MNTNHASTDTSSAAPATTEAPADAAAASEINRAADQASEGSSAPPASSQPGHRTGLKSRSRRSRHAGGSGAMGPRVPDDLSAPQREALDRAARDARVTGHRFDLLQYLRLRRQRPGA